LERKRAWPLQKVVTKPENNYSREMCGDSEAGSNSRLIDFVCHSALGVRVIKKKKKKKRATGVPSHKKTPTPLGPPYLVRDLVESSHVVEALEASL